MKKIVVAAAANLDSEGSVHAATFRSAVTLAADMLRDRHHIDVDVLWINDRSTPDGGAAAAKAVLKSGAQAVVGHFASGAALAAAPLYEAENFPVFLPAATAHALTQFRGMYRLCDSDVGYCRWIAEWITGRSLSKLYVETDGSPHGESVRRGLVDALGPDRLSASPTHADALLFSGMFPASVAFARGRVGASGHRPILLTDDAQSSQLAAQLGQTERDVFVMGFRTSAPTAAGAQVGRVYARRHGEYPGIYFFETVAAMEVAAAWLSGTARHIPVDTVLGRIRFTDDGESHPRRFACLQVANGRLIELENGVLANG